MGALAWAAFHGTAAIFPSRAVYQHLRLGLSILAGFVAWFPLLRIFRVPEAKEIYRLAGVLLRKVL